MINSCPTLTAVASALLEAPQAGWAYGDCKIVESGKAPLIWQSRRVTGPESLLNGNTVLQPGVLITREALERVGGVNEAFQLAMDFDLWLRLAANGFLGVHVYLR